MRGFLIIVDGAALFVVRVDDSATEEEVSRIQALFDGLGLVVSVEATFQRKGVGDLPWLLLVSGPIGVFLAAFAKRAGEGAGELFSRWLGDIYAARKGRNGSVTIQRQGGPEVLLEPDLPAEAWIGLVDVVDRDAFDEIPGHSEQVRYVAGRGWTRSW